MILNDIGIVLLDNFRSRAYLQQLLRADFIPKNILYLQNNNTMPLIPVLTEYKNLFDPNLSVKEILHTNNLPFTSIPALTCNDSAVIHAIQKVSSPYLIYCGGGILKKEILNLGKRFIHVHPGTTPQFRGSTCFYYQIILEEKCGATCFFMEPKLDTGDVLGQKEYSPPTFDDLDRIFDPWMRSDLLISVLDSYIHTGIFNVVPQKNEGAREYYIIHPILKTLAIEICKKC